VGKQPGASPEELEFIFECFLRRLSDGEVLEEMQDHPFPLRSVRFIRDRRREFNAARKVLEIQVQKEFDPIIVKRKEEHFEHLADIADKLLARNLDKVIQKTSPPRGDQFDMFEYFWKGIGITREHLSDILGEHVDAFFDANDVDFEYFLSHLKAEYPEIESKGLDRVVKENPYELIETLRILARRKTFKGTCPVCED